MEPVAPSPVTLVAVPNHFDIVGSRTVDEHTVRPGAPVMAYVRRRFPGADRDIVAEDWIVKINGVRVPVELLDQACPMPGSLLELKRRPLGGGGGGGGGKNAAQTVAMLAVAVAAVAVSAGALGPVLGASSFGAGTWGATLGGLAVGTLGGMAVQAMFPVAQADVSLPELSLATPLGSSATYSWERQSNPDVEGNILPVMFGERGNVVPPVLYRYVETDGENQVINVCYCIGHRVEAIEDCRLQDSPLGYFSQAELVTRLGTWDQEAIPWFSPQIEDQVVCRALRVGEWTTVAVSGNNVRGVAVGIVFGQGLWYVLSSGSLAEMTVEIELRIREEGGEWAAFGEGTYTVTEATQSVVRRSWREVGLPAGSWDIQGRLAAEPHRPGGEGSPEATRFRADCHIEYVQTITPDALRHPGMAKAAVRAVATDELSGDLRTTFTLRRSTVPVFDGHAWVERPADNPAWAAYFLLTDPDAGKGWPVDLVRYQDFLDAAEWDHELDITCSLYLDQRMTLDQALRYLETLGRFTVVKRGRVYGCVSDRPRQPSAFYSVGSIVARSFNKSYLRKSERCTHVAVTFWDRELDWERTTLTIPSPWFNPTTDRRRELRVILYACDRREVAVAHASHLLRQNHYLRRTVSFREDIEAIGSLPGDVIWVQHDLPQWGFGGRVDWAAANAVVVFNDNLVMDWTQTWSLLLRHQEDDRLETVPVSWIDPATRTIYIDGDWPTSAPSRFTEFSVGPTTAVAKLFRILDVEIDASDMTAELRCLEYRPEVNQGADVIPEYENESQLAAVRGLTAREFWRAGPDGSGRSVVEVTWRGAALSWGVWRRPAGGGWTMLGSTLRPCFESADLNQATVWEFSVTQGAPPTASDPVVQVQLLGKRLRPSNVTGLAAWQEGDAVQVAWDQIPDPDRDGYEIRIGPDWQDAEVECERTRKERYRWQPPKSGTWTVLVKAWDTSDLDSETAASVTVNVRLGRTPNLVHEADEMDPSAAAAASGDFVLLDGGPVTGQPALCRLAGLTFNDLSGHTFGDLAGMTFGDGGSPEHVTAVQDLGVAMDFDLRVEFEASAVRSGVRFGDMAGRSFRDMRGSTFGAVRSDALRSLAYRLADGDLVWGEWQPYRGPVRLRGRAYQLSSAWALAAGNTRVEITALSHQADVPEVSVPLYDQAVPVGGREFVLADLGLANHVGFRVETLVQGAAATPVLTKASDRFTLEFSVDGTGVARTADVTVTASPA